MASIRGLYIKSPAELEKYRIKNVSSKVDVNNIQVNEEAEKIYEELRKSYEKLKNSFTKAGDSFIKGKAYVDEATKKSLQKLGNKCRNQGRLCGQKKQLLARHFEFAQLQSKVKQLEDTLESLN